MSRPITIDLPEPTRDAIEALAARYGKSVEDIVAEAAADRVADESEAASFADRAARAKVGALQKVFGRDRTGGEPPRPGDEIG